MDERRPIEDPQLAFSMDRPQLTPTVALAPSNDFGAIRCDMAHLNRLGLN